MSTVAAAKSYRFRVGALDCVALNDGTHIYGPEIYPDAPTDELLESIARHGPESDRIVSPYTCMLVETGGQRVLVDTGGGDFDPEVGKLVDSLRDAGVDPAEIDTVVLTHAHPDHIGGNTTADGELVFANARYVMWREEWDFWTTEAARAGLEEMFLTCVRKNLPPLEGRLELVDHECEIAPGIWALDARGHTPGQMAVRLDSEGESLYYITDVVIHPCALEHPDWYLVYDLDRELALQCKRRIFDLAASEGSLVLAYHFYPFPCLGHVHKVGRAWAWEAIPA
ncbi:MAG: MBL fold metallo-hydrolase [Gaiellaceae bacterium]